MSGKLEDCLRDLIGSPAKIAGQADLTQAAALRRQEIALRQRAGAAAAQLRRARESGAPAETITAIQARLDGRMARLDRVARQANAADIVRPVADAGRAQVFGRVTGHAEKLPLTAALLDVAGAIPAMAAVLDNGSFHLVVDGAIDKAILQISDAGERVLSRLAEPVSVMPGNILVVEIELGPPRPEPGPVPTQLQAPDLIGQSEGVASAILCRLGLKAEIKDQIEDGMPGIVLTQDPKSGTAIKPGSTVTLVVRRALDSTPGPKRLPRLIGMTIAEAEKLLKNLGLGASTDHRPDPGPVGIVLAQEPKEGTPIDGLAQVGLTLSAPPVDLREIPDVLGLTGKEADKRLRAAGFEVDLTSVQDPSAGSGVIGQKPSALTLAPPGSVVTIIINTALTEPGDLVVPQLVGLDIAAAQKQAAMLRLKATVNSVADSAPRGLVLKQNPDAGSRARSGDQIDLTVSSGPAKRGGAEIDRLKLAITGDPRSEALGIDAKRLTQMLEGADITSLEEARKYAELEPAGLRDRLKLGTLADANRFRAILRKALGGID